MIEMVLVALVCHMLQQSLGAWDPSCVLPGTGIACSVHLTVSMTSGGQLSPEHDLDRSHQSCSVLTPSLGCT